jgi:hypothetical protein
MDLWVADAVKEQNIRIYAKNEPFGDPENGRIPWPTRSATLETLVELCR